MALTFSVSYANATAPMNMRWLWLTAMMNDMSSGLSATNGGVKAVNIEYVVGDQRGAEAIRPVLDVLWIEACVDRSDFAAISGNDIVTGIGAQISAVLMVVRGEKIASILGNRTAKSLCDLLMANGDHIVASAKDMIRATGGAVSNNELRFYSRIISEQKISRNKTVCAAIVQDVGWEQSKVTVEMRSTKDGALVAQRVIGEDTPLEHFMVFPHEISVNWRGNDRLFYRFGTTDGVVQL